MSNFTGFLGSGANLMQGTGHETILVVLLMLWPSLCPLVTLMRRSMPGKAEKKSLVGGDIGVEKNLDIDKDLDISDHSTSAVKPVLESLRNRRSIFPRDYVDGEVPTTVVQSMLDAASWAPFHGPRAPYRFVVLGKTAMVEMQKLSLDFYDRNWEETGWADGVRGSESEYQSWRAMTEEEITGRWGPCSFMIANVMQRQAGSKRMPEWEEAAATACAVQNMHVQAASFPGVACYWSSWHDAVRDSSEMKGFLGMNSEDKLLGFLIVASCKPDLRDSRQKKPAEAEWRQ